MSISVIIVSWNARSYLLNCIQSILAQEGTEPIEVIVVDNASTDGSPAAVSAQFPTVRVICNPDNYGFARANNIGIGATAAEHVFLINSDVVVGAGCFRRMVAYMEDHGEVGVLGPKIVGANGQVQRSCMGYPSLWNAFSRALALDSLFPGSRLFGGQLLTFWRHDDIRSVGVINGCFWMVRRSALDQVGLLDERFFIYGEDVDWCRRFNAGGWKVTFFPDAEALHYGGASSANAPVRFYLEMQRAQYQYWTKHHSGIAAVTFLMISLLHHTVRAVGEIAIYPLRWRRGLTSTHKIARSVASIKWIIGALAISEPTRRLEVAGRGL
jgi:GT2 family glycosyltransferase